MDDLTRKTTRALKWRFATVFGNVAMQLIVTCILARVLPIEAFGLIGQAMIFIGLVTVFSEIGMAPVLIQRENISSEEMAHAYTISVIFGCLWAGCLSVCAPWIAAWFQSPDLTRIIQILSVTFVFSGLTLTTIATLRRNLNFQKIFWIELSSYFVGYGFVGITSALWGAGVWSLVYALLTQSVMQLTIAFVLTKKWPKLGFQWTVARSLLGQGTGFSIMTLVLFAARNVESLLIGKFLGTEALGLYSRSYQIATTPIKKFSGVLNSVLYPAYSRIQSDRPRLKTMFLGNLNSVVLLIFPALAFLAVSGREIIIVLLGEKWGNAVIPFQVLCIGAIPLCAHNICEIVVRACGSIRGGLIRHVIYLIGISTVVLTLSPYGLPAVTMGIAGWLLFQWSIMGHLVIGLVQCDWKEFFRAHFLGIILAVSIAVTTGILRRFLINDLELTSPIAILAGMVFIIIPSYLITLAAIPERFLPSPAIQVRTQIKQKISPFLMERYKEKRT